MRLSLLRLVQIEQGRAAEIADCPRSPSEATTAGWEFPLASFINLHTDARLIECRLATAVSDIPERRSLTTCSRLISSRARPIWRPSSRALLMPDLTRSTTSDSLKLRYRRDDGHEQTSHRIPGRHAFSP